MFGCKTNHTLINKVQFKALQAVYLDFSYPFVELLKRDASVPIHVKNFRNLLIEIYEILHRESPSFYGTCSLLSPLPTLFAQADVCSYYPPKHKSFNYTCHIWT